MWGGNWEVKERTGGGGERMRDGRGRAGDMGKRVGGREQPKVSFSF